MKRMQGNYTRAIVIVHGKCEFIMSQYIKNNLRLKMEILADKKGKKSIQITSLKQYLKKQGFESLDEFIQKFDDIEYNYEINSFINFKIFIIMDTDDCTDHQAKEFKNKNIFKKAWYYQYVVPIYDSPNLDTILKKCEVLPNRKIKDDEKVRIYTKAFPIDKNYQTSDLSQLKELSQKLSKDKNTNLEIFIDYCLRCKV